MDGNKNHVKEEDDLSFDELNDLEGDEIFSKFMSQSPVDFAELEQYTDDEMSTILRQEMDDSIVVPVPHMSLTPSTMELSTDKKEPQNKQSISALEESTILNPRRSKRQEMDNSIVVPILRTSPTPSTMELSTDLKNPQKKQSISAMEESAIPNPRRSKRIMLRRASGTKSENMKRVEEFLLEEKARKSSRASSRARAAESAVFEKETIDLSDEDTDLEELHETMGNHVYSHNSGNEEIMMGIRWLRMMASNATTANSPFPFNPGNSVDLLPNLQGREHSAEMLSGFARASLSAARGDDVLPRCTADNNHSLDDSSGNNGLAKGSGKPADLAPTD